MRKDTYKKMRGSYGEILFNPVCNFMGEIRRPAISRYKQKIARTLVQKAGEATKVDEHGSWDFGCEFDDKGRGEALNWDLYDMQKDIHSGKWLAIIQVRQYRKMYKNQYGSVRKNYFLLGRNEDDSVFAHSVEAIVVRRAISDGISPIDRVQNWLFDTDYSTCIRQGDVALVPVRRPAKDAKPFLGGPVIIEGSHVLSSDTIRANGEVYALNPKMKHVPGTHPRISGEGWHKVVVAKRKAFWSFSAPTAD